MKISPARTSAFDILLRIEKEKAHSSVLLANYEESLTPADRALCHEVVLGTLRRQMLLDREIDILTRGKKLDLEVRIAIRLGLYQLRFLTKIPPYSAINESVNLIQRAKKTSAKSLVNAVLRRSTHENVDLVFADEIERISIEQSHPRWLIEKWATALGVEQAEILATTNNTSPPTAFRIIGEITDDVAELLRRSRPSEFVDGCHISPKGLPRSDSAYFQDEASQMTAQAVDVPTGGRFLDVCAAPGGKTGLIGQRTTAALVVAGDINARRVTFLHENCRKQGAQVSIVQYDAVVGLPFADETFDSILIDAPCSGTGTIRHNPEIRYLIEPRDLGELQAKQLRILKNASKLVKKGGSLVYSTCSIEREENEDVCEQFATDKSDFLKVEPAVPRRFITDEGFARTWPPSDLMDGFFIAAFRRN